MITYEIKDEKDGHKSITCLVCGLTSHHPKDVEQHYCGNCHFFHDSHETLPGVTLNQDHLGGWTLLPAAPGTCPECAVQHEREAPHNPQSLYYQYRFFQTHKYWPDWRDAMAHCSDAVKAQWLAELARVGVDVSSGQIRHVEK